MRVPLHACKECAPVIVFDSYCITEEVRILWWIPTYFCIQNINVNNVSLRPLNWFLCFHQNRRFMKSSSICCKCNRYHNLKPAPKSVFSFTRYIANRSVHNVCYFALGQNITFIALTVTIIINNTSCHLFQVSTVQTWQVSYDVLQQSGVFRWRFMWCLLQVGNWVPQVRNLVSPE